MAVSLDLVATFLAVYRTGSITAAAETTGMSQPAVTARLQSLETAINRRLFVRHARGVRPTPAADEFARRVADPLDALHRALAAESDPYGRPVALGGPAELLTEVVLPLLTPLIREGLQLRVTFGLSNDLLGALNAGSLDLALSTTSPRTPRGIRAEPVYEEHFVFVGRPGAAIDAPMIAYAEELPIVRRYWRSIYRARPTMTARVTVPDLRAVLALVRSGAGISVLPRYLCATDLDSGILVDLAEPAAAPRNTMYLAWREGALTNQAISAAHARILEDRRTL